MSTPSRDLYYQRTCHVWCVIVSHGKGIKDTVDADLSRHGTGVVYFWRTREEARAYMRRMAKLNRHMRYRLGRLRINQHVEAYRR